MIVFYETPSVVSLFSVADSVDYRAYVFSLPTVRELEVTFAFSFHFQILIYLPEHLGRKWQYHSVGRLMSKLLHPGNSWKLLKREAMRLFLLWYQVSKTLQFTDFKTF